MKKIDKLEKAIMNMFDGDWSLADAAIKIAGECEIYDIYDLINHLEDASICHITIANLINGIIEKKPGLCICIEISERMNYVKASSNNSTYYLKDEDHNITFAKFYYCWDYWFYNYLVPEIQKVLHRNNAVIYRIDKDEGRLYINLMGFYVPVGHP